VDFVVTAAERAADAARGVGTSVPTFAPLWQGRKRENNMLALSVCMLHRDTELSRIAPVGRSWVMGTDIPNPCTAGQSTDSAVRPTPALDRKRR
jgi:hypothetical protein